MASLERSEDTVQEACLRHLAASVRAAHKIHGFAGGFDAELSALFDKVDLSFPHSPLGLMACPFLGTPAVIELACSGHSSVSFFQRSLFSKA